MDKKLRTDFIRRQYMLSEDFEIYYYNDIHFSSVKSHIHDYYEFFLFLEGDAVMEIDGSLHPLKPGDVIVVPPEVPHHSISRNPDSPYRRFVFWVSKSFYHTLEELSPSYTYLMNLASKNRKHILHCDVISFHTIQAKIFRLIEEMHSDHFGKEETISLCVHDLILHLNRTVYEQEHPEQPKEKQTLCENLLHYIERHLDEELTLDDLAGYFYVSKYHISHVFKEHFGLSVHQYITKKRLARCRDAILGSTDISKACLLYGFKDYSSFFRAFRKEYGMSPKEYRKLFSISGEKQNG